jgi:hypothetical protein
MQALRRGEYLLPWLGSLFVLERSGAAFEKVPIKVKNAPRDSVSAQQSADADADTSAKAPFCWLRFSRNLKVTMRTEGGAWAGSWSGLMWERIVSSTRLGIRSISALVEGRLPAPDLGLEVWLSQDDIRALYRALPGKAKAALRI